MVGDFVTSAAQRRSLEEAIVDTVREPLVVLDDALRVVVASRSFYRAFTVTPQDTEGRFLYELGNGQWDIPALRELLDRSHPAPHHDRRIRGRARFPDHRSADDAAECAKGLL